MQRHHHGEAGFQLIELLVVVAIIGVLAAIAIPHYGTYKSQGIDSTMVHDLESARNAIESYFIDQGTYEGATLAHLKSNGFRRTPNVTLAIAAATADGYTLRACANGGSRPSFVYDSERGNTQGESGTCT